MMAGRVFVSRFSPNRTDPAVLEAIFVQRNQLADAWLERLRDSVLTDVKHQLLAVGPRGCGKSHLVALLVGRLRNDSSVRERVRIAWLPEDETTPSFWKFLLRILRALHAEYGDEFPPPPHDQLTDATDDRRSTVLTEYLLEKLDGRTLLVVVENLDDVLRGLKAEGQKRWRAFLQEHAVAATLATAQRLTKDVSNRDRPFFNFFQIEHLRPLSADEALLLLRKIAEEIGNSPLVSFLESPTGRARVRAIRHIAGGSHRVFIILSEFATRENLDDLVTAFEELLDELTPYYQERLRWLSDQQREIVEFLCRQTATVQVKEIAAELFLSEQAAAAQLKSLRDKGYVASQSVGRESRYELAEPLMRLCVEVKDPQREPIRLIVEFLRIWYDRAVLETRLQCLPDNAERERRFFQAALRSHRPGVPGPIEAALHEELAAARACGDPEEVVRVLIDLAAVADTSERCLAAAWELTSLGRHAEALTACDRAVELQPNSSVTWHSKGYVLHELGRYDEALHAEDRAIAIRPDDPLPWNGRGYALNRLLRYEDALAALSRAVELCPNDAIFWGNMAWTLNRLGRNLEASAAYQCAVELNPKDADAWIGKGRVLNELERHEEACAAFDEAIRLNPGAAYAWDYKGDTLRRLGRHAEALAAYDQAIQIEPAYAFAWGVKGYELNRLGRHEDALAAYERAMELMPDSDSSWYNVAWTLNELGRYAEALPAYGRYIELSPDDAYAWRDRGWTKIALRQLDSAGDDFRQAINLNAKFASAFEGLAEVHLLQGNWEEVERLLSERFRLPPCLENQAKSEALPALIGSIFRTSSDGDARRRRVNRLVEIASEAQAEWEQLKLREKQTPGPSSAVGAIALTPPNPIAMLGDSLVRSLTTEAYAGATAAALDAWADLWNDVAKRHRSLSVAARLFSVGVRFLQAEDERVLLDLVKEERTILRDLFDLEHETDNR